MAGLWLPKADWAAIQNKDWLGNEQAKNQETISSWTQPSTETPEAQPSVFAWARPTPSPTSSAVQIAPPAAPAPSSEPPSTSGAGAKPKGFLTLPSLEALTAMWKPEEPPQEMAALQTMEPQQVPGEGSLSPNRYQPKEPNTQTLPVNDNVPNQGVPRVPGQAPRSIDHSSRESFIGSMAPLAREVEAETGIPAGILVAVPLNEQGWRNPAPGNNYYGIKGKNPRTGASSSQPTWEVVNGQRVNINDEFRAYDDPADSMRDFAAFLRDNPRYAGALQVLRETGDPVQFIRAVHAAGYATDPAWSNKIISIASELPGGLHPVRQVASR